MSNDNTFTLCESVCVHETESALLISSEELSDEVWVPKSQVIIDSDVHHKGDEGELVVTEWVAEKEGWL